MNNLIYDIFDTLGNTLPGMEEADKIISEEIKRLLEPLKKTMTAKEWEGVQDILYSASYCSKREAFAAGFYYGISLLLDKRL